jgi:hypothetical protein
LAGRAPNGYWTTDVPRRRDVTKALKGAVNAGLAIKRFEIDRDGKIVVIAGRPDNQEQANEWDGVE